MRAIQFIAALAVSLPIALAHAAGPKIPRLANGKPDFSGIWQTTSAAEYDLEPHSARPDAPPGPGVVEGNVIPYLPEALEQKKKNFAARDELDPRLKCWTLGTPRGIYYPEPFQIFQRDRDLTIVFQFGQSVRTIHTNGTLHPVVTDNEFWLGDSRGHWEGDTLVVDVRDFTEETWLDRAGNFHSPDMHLVERFTPMSADHILYEVTVEDPTVFTRPWKMSMPLYRRQERNAEVLEYECLSYLLDETWDRPAGEFPFH